MRDDVWLCGVMNVVRGMSDAGRERITQEYEKRDEGHDGMKRLRDEWSGQVMRDEGWGMWHHNGCERRNEGYGMRNEGWKNWDEGHRRIHSEYAEYSTVSTVLF